MPPKKSIVGVAIISTAIGATLISLLAALLRRRKKNVNNRPDVLNEALPIDMTLQGVNGLLQFLTHKICTGLYVMIKFH